MPCSDGRVVFVSPKGKLVVVHNAGGFALVEVIEGEGEILLGATASADWEAAPGFAICVNDREHVAYLRGNMSLQLAIRLALQTEGKGKP